MVLLARVAANATSLCPFYPGQPTCSCRCYLVARVSHKLSPSPRALQQVR